MEHFEQVVIGVIVSLVVRVVGLFLVPAILLIAARALWHTVPRWMPCVIGTAAVVKFLTSIPSLLVHPLVQESIVGISVKQYGKIAMISNLANWSIGLAFAIAVLGIAKHIRTMTEQGAADQLPARSESGTE